MTEIKLREYDDWEDILIDVFNEYFKKVLTNAIYEYMHLKSAQEMRDIMAIVIQRTFAKGSKLGQTK